MRSPTFGSPSTGICDHPGPHPRRALRSPKVAVGATELLAGRRLLRRRRHRDSRLGCSSVTLTLSHEENEALLAATPDPVEPDDEGEAPPLPGSATPVTRAVLGWVLLGQALSRLQLAGFAVTVEAIANGRRYSRRRSSPDVVQVVDGVVDEVAGERRDGEGGAVTAPTGAVPLPHRRAPRRQAGRSQRSPRRER